MGSMQERITTTKKGSITSVQAIYVPADDLTDPAPATTFAHLDATTVLSRAIAELGIYPAVDPLDSTSRIMDPNIIGAEHYNVARSVQKILQDYKSLQVSNILINDVCMYYFVCVPDPYLDRYVSNLETFYAYKPSIISACNTFLMLLLM